MTSATRTRKPKSKPARSVRLHTYEGGAMPEEMMVEMTVGSSTSSYFVTEIPADFGRGFQVGKLLCDGGETYHVHIDVQHGHHTCDCPGGTYHGHCKHMEAIAALVQSGKLPRRPATPKPAPSTSTTPVILPMPAPMKPAAVALEPTAFDDP